MQAPKFWRGPGMSAAALLLSPAAHIYGLLGRIRNNFSVPWRASVPVICVGNLVAGGAGKTPVVLKLIEMLKQRGLKPHALSRGYGGSLTGPTQVDASRHTYRETGDEPLLLSKHAPTWIAKDRAEGAKAATGAEVIIMDDGFQNPSLAKDLSLVVVNGSYGFGNAQIIPAGPLRESISNGLRRAHAVVLIGPDSAGVEDSIRHHGRDDLPILRATINPGPEADALKGQTVHAFAGIGEPDKFFRTLENLGCTVAMRAPFADHHPYNSVEIEVLKTNASQQNAVLVTTEKDAVRLPENVQDGIKVLTITLEWEDEAGVNKLLDQLEFDGR
jgi:tetraacyldisaccharide 4'-kinase